MVPVPVSVPASIPASGRNNPDDGPTGEKSKKGAKGGRKKGKGGGLSGPISNPAVVQVQPIARPARMKRRHWGLLFSFVLLVALPLAVTIFYLWTTAEDRYASTTGFTVRSQESGGAAELLGGLAQFAGGTTASDSDILYEFIQSQEMVEAVDAKLDLRARYSQPWPRDWAFAIWPDATLEDLIWYWQRIVSISYDSGTGLIDVQAVGFDPVTAQMITSEIVQVSQDRINALNSQSRGRAKMRCAMPMPTWVRP